MLPTIFIFAALFVPALSASSNHTEQPIVKSEQFVLTVIETKAPGNHSITIGSENIPVPENIKGMVLEDLKRAEFDERADPIQLSFWKKVKHAIDKTLKKLGDKIIDILTDKIVG